VGQPRVAGPLVGYELATLGRNGRYGSITVLDARTGRRLRSIRQGSSDILLGNSYAEVTDLKLTRRGSVAWIVRTGPYEGGGGPVTYEVRRALSARGSGSLLLDSGPDIDPASLVIRDGTVSWREDGKPVSARVP